MEIRPICWAGRVLGKLSNELLTRSGMHGTWIDVGAHLGELTLGHAQRNPGLRVYALEPNLRVAARMIGRAPNFVVIPMAVAEKDGCADFHVNAFDPASSLLPLREEGLRSWVGVANLKVESSVTVPTVRLDTLMRLLGIEKVDFLKIDTQGMDLAVLRSAAERLHDIARIMVEVETAPLSLYSGAPSKDEVVNFLCGAGFSLVGVEEQTYAQEENLTFLRTPES